MGGGGGGGGAAGPMEGNPRGCRTPETTAGQPPGETRKCRSFPVLIDSREIIRFTDTPGFQVPRKSLEWFQRYDGPIPEIVSRFIQANRDNEVFRDECELFTPIARGAGIIYVADGSRPVRRDDRAEMEILRLTARPEWQSSIQGSADRLSEDWKTNSGSTSISSGFSHAHNAAYKERIASSYQSERHRPGAGTGPGQVSAFRSDWDRRNHTAAGMITDLLADCLRFTVSKTIADSRTERNGNRRTAAADLSGKAA